MAKEGNKAAYGYEALNKIQAVSVMPSLKDAYSRGENNQSRQNSPRELNKDFARMFTEACDKNETNTIHVSINSYTKNVTPFSTFIAMKDYTHQIKQVVLA